ncbi:recombinase family protein [Sphingomonas sp. BAUL-RG-20F-R05-02]|uniref:recombinase family protein n=1 Tax=Sphingomonas sp. BAUL-RG-20F-R05-02 TaxID=2914830 RepID=UPI001F59BE6E|nr:recombinase family protein [Sphingomonas sp. BAUL-RG-20F-R05-02]
MLVGYARVSTTDQSLNIQIASLIAAGCEKVFSEKLSGTTSNRPQLQTAMEFVREGDVLLVMRLDRFARSNRDLHNMLHQLVAKGVGFRCIEQAGIDTTTSLGKLMLGVLGSVAEFETDLRRERQREGIDAAKAKGAYKGGKARIDPARVRAMLSEGMRPGEVAKALGCSRMTVHRASA